jgi:DNA-binding NarL/FixJ family response regulator
VAKQILLVDDSELIRLATRHFLESQPGFVVCGQAVDGIDALEKAKHLNPDLIILDIAMPRMNGLQTARELRARMYRVPIILFTWYADAVQPGEPRKLG